MSGTSARNLGLPVGTALQCTSVAGIAAGHVVGPHAKSELLRLCARVGYTPH